MPEKTDEEIARAVQGGDKESFGVLVERYEPKIARYARKFLSHYEDRRDLVQEVFIKAYMNIQSFDGGRRFSPWLYRIAHNEFVNAIKKKHREPISFFDLDTLFPHLTSKETADGKAVKKELQKTLTRYLDSLDAKYREPLILYYFEGMNYQEIADILRIPLSTVG